MVAAIHNDPHPTVREALAAGPPAGANFGQRTNEDVETILSGGPERPDHRSASRSNKLIRIAPPTWRRAYGRGVTDFVRACRDIGRRPCVRVDVTGGTKTMAFGAILSAPLAGSATAALTEDMDFDFGYVVTEDNALLTFDPTADQPDSAENAARPSRLPRPVAVRAVPLRFSELCVEPIWLLPTASN
ncbi:MAG: hypothetical protein U0531_21485 [Dehalococcoidia bacterium]